MTIASFIRIAFPIALSKRFSLEHFRIEFLKPKSKKKEKRVVKASAAIRIPKSSGLIHLARRIVVPRNINRAEKLPVII